MSQALLEFKKVRCEVDVFGEGGGERFGAS